MEMGDRLMGFRNVGMTVPGAIQRKLSYYAVLKDLLSSG
jgi:hypothetical protein